jgi:hypothetical protein
VPTKKQNATAVESRHPFVTASFRDLKIGTETGYAIPALFCRASLLLWLLTAVSVEVRAAEELPNRQITPGAINTQVNQDNIDTTICVKGWSKTIRPPSSFTNGLKHIKLRQYGYAASDIDNFELDHLVPLSIGGAPEDPHNLWPQPHVGQWTAKDKNALESSLHNQVCDGKVPLREAQRAMATDWIAAYEKYMSSRAKRKRAARLE